MDFGEALRRFTQTKSEEVAESIRRAKGSAGGEDPDAPGTTESEDQGEGGDTSGDDDAGESARSR